MNTPLLQVEHLQVALTQTSRALLHDVSFSLAPHRCLGVIGESGSGVLRSAAAAEYHLCLSRHDALC
ncbi:MAG: hypothetical protein ACR5LF_13980 [Symbiopectobacterium sp.]